MSKSVNRMSPVVRQMGLAVVAGALMGGASLAMARPVGLYFGGASGVSVNTRSCGQYDFKAAGGACDRASMGGKWFGGYYLNPDLGAEVSYMRFGSVNRRKGAATTSPAVGDIDSADIQDSARAWTVGLNVQVEIFQSFTNHLRLGWAFTRNDTSGYERRVSAISRLTPSDPYYASAFSTTDMGKREYRGVPYFGAGMSGLLMPHVRVFSAWDFVIDGHRSKHLLSAGVQGEF